MTQRICNIEGCDKPFRARGLCSMHWKRTYGTRTKYAIICQTCGHEWLHCRRDGRFCSDRCKGDYYSLTTATKCALPPGHPVMVETKRRRDARRQAERAARIEAGRALKWTLLAARECPGCGCLFSPLNQPHMVCCSKACKRRVARRRRRALEHNTLNQWRWSDFMRIARKFDYCCAYCGVKPGRLDPDHVVPLSRGGTDSPANLLPTCPLCNSNKNAMTLVEWDAWLRVRGLPARVTSWTVGDPRYVHLTDALLAA